AHAAPARSAREVPDSLRITRLVEERDLVDVVVAEHAALGDGKLAVITAGDRVAPTRELLATRLAAELEAPGGDVLAAPVAVLDEPAEVGAGGPGDLYVAMTRPTRRLHVVHRGELPAGLEG